MKKILYSAMAAALVVTACQKNLKDGSDLSMNEPSSPAQVSISLRSNATKANPQATEAENKVNRVDAFVFNNDGTLDGYANVLTPTNIKDNGETPTDIVVKATTGAGKRFVVIVNAADSDNMGDVTKLSDLEATARTFLLENNKRDGFQMYGYNEGNLSSGKNSVSIEMNRAVSRVKIGKITRNFSIPSLASQTMTIEKIYISNVVGTVCNTDDSDEYFKTIKTGLNDTWFNKYSVESDHINHPYDGYIDITADVNVKDLTSKTIGSEIANGSSDETGYSFYVMPNDVIPAYAADDNTDEKCLAKEQALQGPNYWVENGNKWKPELTKLVIETKLAGKTYYYAIPLVKRESLDENKPSYPEGKIIGGIGSNETFNFSEIVLTRPGSEDPDTPVSIAEVDFQLQIQDWTVVPMATGENGKYEI